MSIVLVAYTIFEYVNIVAKSRGDVIKFHGRFEKKGYTFFPKHFTIWIQELHKKILLKIYLKTYHLREVLKKFSYIC